jgi:osmoprotectant transport system permease protein
LLIVAGALTPNLARPHATYVIGAKTFTEQYILAALIEQRLAAAGLSATRREGLGSNVIFDALKAGDIDVYVDYSGTLWANQLHRDDARSREEVLAGVKAWLAEHGGIAMPGALGFENAYALAMARSRAEALGIRSIADLAPRAPSLTIAGDYEFFARPEWAAIRRTYGLSFRQERQMQPEFMYPAVSAGEVDVITAYTSDGRIAKHDLVVLDDPKHAIPPYDAILLAAPKRANDRALTDALSPLIGAIDVSLMREANLRATGNASPAQVAQWLWGEIEKRK